jgi:hypothetical protein
MPYLIFPSFAPPTWSYTWPIKQTPFFNTIKRTPASGRGENRISTTEFPRWKFVWDISYLKGDNQQISVNTAWQTLLNFYMSAQGSFANWLFLHPYDNSAGTYTVAGSISSGNFIPEEQVIQSTSDATANVISALGGTMTIGPYAGTPNGSNTWVGQKSGAIFTPTAVPVLASSMAIATGDGTTTAFSMIRTIVTGGAQELVQNFVNAPFIFLNGAIDSSANYSIDEYGTITFTSAPGSGVVISWTGQFYYLCHFSEDSWEDLQEDLYQIWSIHELKFESVLL